MTGPEELLSRLLDGSLSPEDEPRLLELLRQDDEFRRRAAELVSTDRLLRYRAYLQTDRPDLVVGVMRRIKCEERQETALFAEAVATRLAEAAPAQDRPASRRISARLAGRRLSQVRRSGPVRRWLYLAVAGAAAVLLLAVLQPPPGTSRPPVPAPPQGWTAELTSVRGRVELSRDGRWSPVQTGAELRPGDALRTEAQSRAIIRYGDATTVEMNEETLLALGGSSPAKHPALKQGDVYVLAAAQPADRPMTFNTGGFDQVVILGTEFELSRLPDRTVLKMVAGRTGFGLPSAGATVQVDGGYRSDALNGAAPGAPQPCPADEVALWRSGRRPPVAAVRTEPPPPPPPPPVPLTKSRSLGTLQDKPLAIVLAARDDSGGTPVFAITKGPEHGRLEGTPPNVTYHPNAGFSGEDRFSFQASNQTGTSTPATVTIAVKRVNATPVAQASAAPLRGMEPLKVRLSAAGSRDPDGEIATFRWNFGDGQWSQTADADHLYTNPGTYTAELTVTDRDGASASAKVTIAVEPDPDKVADPTELVGHYGGQPKVFILTWKDRSGNEDGFQIDRAESKDAGLLDYRPLATTGPDATSAKVQLSPTPGKPGTFHFRVRAFNTRTGRTSGYAHFVVNWAPGQGQPTLNWPPAGWEDKKR
ncbi:MAG TPA: PKD domain-containing protein [Planctomycetota bacterium]|nr:PKD domain-containing protein [Planctomycetota bacterium]